MSATSTPQINLPPAEDEESLNALYDDVLRGFITSPTESNVDSLEGTAISEGESSRAIGMRPDDMHSLHRPLSCMFSLVARVLL